MSLYGCVCSHDNIIHQLKERIYMLYYSFKDYEEFKELFGIVEHGNGVKSRKNKILLALYKDRRFLKAHIRYIFIQGLAEMKRHYRRRRESCNTNCNFTGERLMGRILIRLNEQMSYNHYRYSEKFSPLTCKTLPTLKTYVYSLLEDEELRIPGSIHYLKLNGRYFHSNSFETDSMEGLCEDGTLNAIRYRNIEKGRVFKMKAGKMFNHILSCNVITENLPEQINRWMSEEFVAEWIDHARRCIGDTEYELHVDDNFEAIYDRHSCAGYDEDSGSFGSCMVGDDQWTFYRDAVKAKAAYLADKNGLIYARCIVFTEVHEVGSDRIWRLAERQYSKSCDPSLQRQLVSALIQGGHIDGHKAVGASCGAKKMFVDCEGNSLEDKMFWIDCHLKNGDTLSYQDSFKSFDYDAQRADNYGCGDIDLDVTDSELNFNDHSSDVWSEYNQEYIYEDDAYYVETRDDYFYHHQVADARVYDGRGCYHWETCFEEDCIEVNGEYFYAGYNAEDPEGNGLCCCDRCEEFFVDGEGFYSDLTGETYCCGDCLDEAEEKWHRDNGHVLSAYDGEWFEDADDVITVYEWNRYFERFLKSSISIESFNNLVEYRMATEYNGLHVIDKVLYDGEPVHWEFIAKAA